MVNFIGRLKTFILCTFLVAIAAIIGMFYYSIRYSYVSRLEIKYLGTLNIERYLHERPLSSQSSSNAASANLSHLSSSTQATDNVNLLQGRLNSNHSDYQFKAKVLEVKSDYSNSSFDNGTTHQNRSSIYKAKAGVNGSIPTRDQDENLCPKNVSTLVGRLSVNDAIPRMEEVEKEMAIAHGGWVSNGGCWKPIKCKARVKMALIIPYRNRYEQLSIFVRHMHPVLKRQNVDYRIFVAEQAGNTPFNRAILFNIGFKESLKFDQYECFIFHDVDLIPEDDRNEYSCPSSPRHMSVAVDKFNYRLPYNGIFGGAGSFSKEHFELINGFSNQFWGWGGEDDDLYTRITVKKLKLKRPAMQIGRYIMLKKFHFRSSKANPERSAKLRNSAERMSTDGLNSLKYSVLNVTEYPLYTLVSADVKDAM